MTQTTITIDLPFKPDGKILELGCGDIPIRHDANWQTMDMRKLPTVDYVCDLEDKWCVPDASFDGVFGKFVIEHVSWRKVPHFAAECFRVLKSGGAAMMVGPNTLAQCKEIARLDKIGIEESALIFGGQEERGWNEHKAAFSPDYAVKIFKEAGFERVEVKEWPGQIWTGARTDMIIYAWKSETVQSPKPAISAPTGYPMSNPPQVENMKQMSRFQEIEDKMRAAGQPVPTIRKVGLNIGCFTVMVKSNLKTFWTNCDILDMTQYGAQNGYQFKQFDARQSIPWTDCSVDFIVASHFLEHITRAEGDKFLAECFRVLKPGGVVRITVPDTRNIANAYSPEPHDNPSEIKSKFSFNEGVKNAEDDCEAFWNLLTAGHVTAYDEDSLGDKMNKAGFKTYQCNPGTSDKERAKPIDSNAPEILEDTLDMYSILSLVIEGVKPKSSTIEAKPTILDQTWKETKTEVDTSKRKLHIGLASTQFFGVPPKSYGGLELIIWQTALGLSELGHEVTLFAPEGSQTPPGGHLVTIGPALQNVQVDWLASERAAYDIYKQHLNGLDILHGMNWFGIEYTAKPMPGLHICHTHHGGLNAEWWLRSKPPYKLNFIGVSDWMTRVYASQSIPSKFVYNGIALEEYPYQEKKGDRLLFVGRLDNFKRPHIAIEIAKKMNLGLDIVGGSFVSDIAYMNSIKEACDGNQIKLHLDASQEEKVYLYQNAKAVIFCSKMGEPFGLIGPEANATGTAVIGSRDGAIPETIEEGVTGFVCDTVEQMIEAVKKVDTISPLACRQRVERLFSRQVMSKNYEALYREILAGREW